MRFIGNKEKLLNNIYQTVTSIGISNGLFCDFFAGTTNVGRFFKQKGFSVLSSDLLYFSFVLQKAYIENNKEPTFSKLLPRLKVNNTALFSKPLDLVLVYLNSLEGEEGFIYKNYTEEGSKVHKRKFFTPENGKKIDAIRSRIEKWKKQKLILESEYYVLLACLIESVPYYANISGVYAAFLKSYDPRALKKFEIKPITLFPGNKKHKVYNKDSMQLINDLECDVLYLDPPYNQRQYGPNYHLLDTIAKYDDPEIKGVTGLRDTSFQKSSFCNKKTALQSLEDIASKAKYRYLLLSYNSEGIMPQDKIMEILKKFGKVKLIEVDYTRFKSNSNGKSAHLKTIREQIYLLQPT